MLLLAGGSDMVDLSVWHDAQYITAKQQLLSV